MRTARTVTTSDSAAAPPRAARSSYRQASTTVCSRPSCRAASRRNAAFLVFDSTMRSRTAGTASFIGIAGDPPPDPMSVTDTPGRGSRCTAASGSTTSLSRPWSSSASAVRLMRRFQRIRRPTYAARFCRSGSATCSPARRALAAMRAASREFLMSGVMGAGQSMAVRVAGPATAPIVRVKAARRAGSGVFHVEQRRGFAVAVQLASGGLLDVVPLPGPGGSVSTKAICETRSVSDGPSRTGGERETARSAPAKGCTSDFVRPVRCRGRLVAPNSPRGGAPGETEECF